MPGNDHLIFKYLIPLELIATPPDRVSALSEHGIVLHIPTTGSGPYHCCVLIVN